MNFLAHLYLSGDNKPLRIGNFIADHVKGKSIERLSSEIIQGVLLHRKIDHFTDHHPVVEKTRILLRPYFHKYAGVVADVYFDHFLALKWDDFSNQKLETYSSEFYKETEKYSQWLPERTIQMLPFMISNNWLLSYASVNGIGKVLGGMARRTPFESGMEKGAEVLTLNYSQLESDFNTFFPQLEDYVKKEISVTK